MNQIKVLGIFYWMVGSLLIHSTPLSAARNIAETWTEQGRLGDGSLVTVEVLIKKLTEKFSFPRPFMWGGDLFDAPRTYISSLSTRVGSRQLWIPLSVYSDLGAPAALRLETSLETFDVVIRGGDAGGSYTAILQFNRTNVISKRVTHGEFPDQVWEEFRYSFISPDSPM